MAAAAVTAAALLTVALLVLGSHSLQGGGLHVAVSRAAVTALGSGTAALLPDAHGGGDGHDVGTDNGSATTGRAGDGTSTHGGSATGSAAAAAGNAAAAEPDGGVGSSRRPLRLALIADAHLIGPQYVCCSESNDVDNESIMRTVARLEAAQHKLAAVLEPSPDAVVFLGDVVHNGYFSHDFDWYTTTVPNAHTIAADIFARFPMPVHYLWGNHDYAVTCGDAAASYPRQLSHRLFEHFFRAPPYSSFRVGPYNVLLLNALLGPTWEPESPVCNTKLASLGLQQLRWLHQQLSLGLPTLVFVHHPLPAFIRHEAAGAAAQPAPADGLGSRNAIVQKRQQGWLGADPELRGCTLAAEGMGDGADDGSGDDSGSSGAPPLFSDLLCVLMAHRGTLMGVFTGHYHRGLDWQGAYPFPLRTLPSLRYDSDNFFVMDLAPDGSGWDIVDWRKNKGGARCSETWAYGRRRHGGSDIGPDPAAPQEDGSCGDPTTETEPRYRLPDVLRPEDVPGPTGHQFNPERSCSETFLPQFLATCLHGGGYGSADTRTGSGGSMGLGAGAGAGFQSAGSRQHAAAAAAAAATSNDVATADSDAAVGAAGPAGSAAPSAECCAVLGEHLRPSSAAYAASCLCLPRFWRAAQRTFRQAGLDAAEVLGACVSQHGRELQFPGRLHGSCLGEGGSVPA